MIKKAATIPLQYNTAVSPFLAEEFDKALEWLKENEFNGIELCIAEPERVNVNELNAKLNKYSLEVVTISTGQSRTLEGISMTDEDEDRRKRAVKRIIEHVNLAALIKSPFVTIGLIRGAGSNGNKYRDLELLRTQMKICLKHAMDKGISLLLEPINRYETNLINSCEEAMEFINSLTNSISGLGILYDTFHSNIEDRNMSQAILESGERILHVHLADSNRWLPGDGHIDFETIINLLKSNSYKGYVSLETLNLPDINHIKQNAGKSLKKIIR